MTRSIILIPARMKATRLPDKPLADIGGEPMIVRVWRCATRAEAGRVVVCTDAEAIKDAIQAVGGEAVMTRADHASGSDRIYEALSRIDPDGDFDTVVNVQGDMPTMDPGLIQACLGGLDTPLNRGGAHVSTIAAEIVDPALRLDPNVVKAIGTPIKGKPRHLRALYFTRATAPSGDGPLYHHEGLYAFRRPAIERFVALPPSPLEQRERLEQLRLLENDMRITIVLVDKVPLGVNTPAELEHARKAVGI